MESVERFSSRYGSLVLCTLFLPLFVVILLDRRAWPWDEAFYGQHSLALFRVLMTTPAQWQGAMVHVLGDRAPALVWLGQFFTPLARLMPQAQTGLLLATLSIQTTSIFLLYRALRQCLGQATPALFASSLLACGPLFAGLTYRYFVDPLQVSAVVWLLLLAVWIRRMNSWIVLAQLMSAVLFGLLVKTSTPLYQLPLILYIAAVLLRRSVAGPSFHVFARPHQLVLHFVLAGLLLACTASWYGANFDATYQHVIQASSGELSQYYGHRGNLLNKLTFWSVSFHHAFLSFGLDVLLLMLLAVALVNRFKARIGLVSADAFALLSVAWMCAVLVLFSRTTNEDTRYLIGLAPYLAVAAAWIFYNSRSSWSTAAISILLLTQFVRVSAQAFGVVPPSPQFSSYLLPYVSDATALHDSLFASRVTGDATLQHAVLVGSETADFDGSGLAFYREAQSASLGLPPCDFIGFNWTLPNPDDAWNAVPLSEVKYFVYRKDQTYDKSPFNRLADVMLAKVQASNSFQFAPQKSNFRVLVYEHLSAEKQTYNEDAKALAAGFQGTNPDESGLFGFLDYPKKGSTVIPGIKTPIAGWSVSKAGVQFVEIQIDDNARFRADKVSRPDVFKSYPSLPSTGYNAEYQFNRSSTGRHRIQVISHSRNGAARVIATVVVSAAGPQ